MCEKVWTASNCKHRVGGIITIIKPMKDGPLVAKGIPNLQDPVGTDVKPEKPAFGLCRCGQSKKTNPFDGTHHDVKWKYDA